MSRPPVWAPWRIDHILDPDKHTGGCVLCELALAPPDEERLVLHRGTTAYVVMNRYPYTSGHLMVVPAAHGADFIAQPAEVRLECSELAHACVRVLAAVLRPDGFNVGTNLGEAAGAGIPGHLHWHVVPRWRGDNNFMPVLGDVRVIPEHLRATWRKLRPSFAQGVSR